MVKVVALEPRRLDLSRAYHALAVSLRLATFLYFLFLSCKIGVKATFPKTMAEIRDEV